MCLFVSVSDSVLLHSKTYNEKGPRSLCCTCHTLLPEPYKKHCLGADEKAHELKKNKYFVHNFRLGNMYQPEMTTLNFHDVY
jgi:hypothetical protein